MELNIDYPEASFIVSPFTLDPTRKVSEGNVTLTEPGNWT